VKNSFLLLWHSEELSEMVQVMAAKLHTLKSRLQQIVTLTAMVVFLYNTVHTLPVTAICCNLNIYLFGQLLYED
jgi:hypothetical protein